MVNRLRSDETKLINWLTQQGDFIRAHGRFPFSWRILSWSFLGIIGLVLFAILEISFLEKGKPWRPNPVVLCMSLSLLVQTVQGFLRTRLRKVETGLPALETADRVEAELRRLGYGPMWTEGKGVGIMRLETSTGFGKERHILVLFPDDGHLWITALNADSPFFSLNRPKPFRKLLAKLREACTHAANQSTSAQTAA